MDEIFNKLVESELLNEETKKSLVEAFQIKLDEEVKLARAEATASVREELTEQFIIEKNLIVEALDTKSKELVREHIEELFDDINAFRDLEAEYAEKIVEAKSAMATTLKKDMIDLVEKLDQFNTEWMEEAFVELEDSINEVKKIQFGKEIFEAVAKTFEKNFSDTNETLNALKEAQEELTTVRKELTESKKLLENAEREHKLNALLENLHGRPREIMAQILSGTETDKLEEGYKKFIGRVLSGEGKAEKENASASVLAESDKALEGDLVIKTGDAAVVTESESSKQTSVLSEEMKKRLQRSAGIIE